MYIMRMLVLVLVFVSLVFNGHTPIADVETPSGVSSSHACQGKYIRGIPLDMIERWEKQTQKYAPIRLRQNIPVSYMIDGISQTKTFEAEGGAFVIGRYIITASHMIRPPEYDKVIISLRNDLQKEQILTDVKVLADQQWFQLVFGDLQIGGKEALRFVVADEQFHLALLSLQNDLPDSYAIPLGFFEKLSVGASVFIGGNPFALGTVFRSGEVSSLRIREEQLFLPQAEEMLPNTAFIVHFPVMPGDSGHMVYAMTPCGDPEIVGMAFHTAPGGYWGDLRWIISVETIRAFALKNGVDLDALQKKHAK